MGWIIINPEKMNMNEIILYLSRAKKILTSYGAISYAHEIFFNRDCNWYFLKFQYLPYNDNISKYKVIQVKSLYIDNNDVKKIIKQIK